MTTDIQLIKNHAAMINITNSIIASWYEKYAEMCWKMIRAHPELEWELQHPNVDYPQDPSDRYNQKLAWSLTDGAVIIAASWACRGDIYYHDISISAIALETPESYHAWIESYIQTKFLNELQAEYHAELALVTSLAQDRVAAERKLYGELKIKFGDV
jgi:hypothetical protein